MEGVTGAGPWSPSSIVFKSMKSNLGSATYCDYQQANHLLTCLLRNLYAGQEATVRTEHGKQTGSK